MRSGKPRPLCFSVLANPFLTAGVVSPSCLMCSCFLVSCFSEDFWFSFGSEELYFLFIVINLSIWVYLWLSLFNAVSVEMPIVFPNLQVAKLVFFLLNFRTNSSVVYHKINERFSCLSPYVLTCGSPLVDQIQGLAQCPMFW